MRAPGSDKWLLFLCCSCVAQVAAEGDGEWLPAHLQRELAPGIAAQLTTERSALVSDASRLLETVAARQGRAAAPLVEKLLFDALQVAGAGNKTIAKFVRSAVTAVVSRLSSRAHTRTRKTRRCTRSSFGP